jgi:hypothetical protein
VIATSLRTPTAELVVIFDDADLGRQLSSEVAAP